MGSSELIEALREKGERDVRAVWDEFEAEARKIRAEAEERIAQKRAEYHRRQSSAVEEQVEAVLSEARRQAADVRLEAWHGLSERLHRIALSRLGVLRADDYEEVFGALVRELPPYGWETVRVNPEDSVRADGYFPGATIVADGGIAGGLEVSARGGRIRVTNSFEKRFERAWPDVLAEVVQDVSREIPERGNTSQP